MSIANCELVQAPGKQLVVNDVTASFFRSGVAVDSEDWLHNCSSPFSSSNEEFQFRPIASFWNIIKFSPVHANNIEELFSFGHSIRDFLTDSMKLVLACSDCTTPKSVHRSLGKRISLGPLECPILKTAIFR